MGAAVVEGKLIPCYEVFHLHSDVVRRHQPVTGELLGHRGPGSDQGICGRFGKQKMHARFISFFDAPILLPVQSNAHFVKVKIIRYIHTFYSFIGPLLFSFW